MVLQRQLDLVEENIATTNDFLQSTQENEKAPGRKDLDPDNGSIVVSFELGDDENSGNWPKVIGLQDLNSAVF